MEFQPYDPPHVPQDINPTGCYRKHFSIPSNWDGRKIFLHFDGVKSAAFVWLNGKYIGYHEGGMTPAEFDITQKITKGDNVLAVMVMRWSDGSYLEDQDMFRFSGIYRDVYIYSKPQISLNDLFIKTELDENYKDANLILDLTLKNYSGLQSKVKVRYSLFDKNNKEIFSNTSDALTINDKIETTVTQKVSNPLKWSDEKPNLYTLIVELLNEKNEVTEIVSQHVGFRKLEMKNGIAMLNGMPVYFRGTNRHEHNADGGKTLTKELMIKDIQLLKQFNFNAVRTSHYPNDPLWYDLCDEYGIYLMDEVNAECHYTENTFSKRKEYFPSFMDRFIRMVQRDKNHPSVVIWSTGNECGLNEPHYMMADYIKKFDPSRFLMHQANGTNGTAPYSDIAGPRYPTPSQLRKFGLESDKPIVMGEYAHAMGNSLGHFDEFWNLIYEMPKLQGGFVWDWIDQGLNVKARFVKDYSTNNIQCGIMGNPEFVKGLEDNAIKLSGLDDWVEVYDDPRLDFTGKNLVIEATVYPQKFYIENPIVTKGFQYGIKTIKEDTLSFYINGFQNSVKVKLPGDWYSNWHKIKAVYDGKEMSLYIDNKIAGTKNYSWWINSSHYPVNIGRDASTDRDQHLGWLSDYIFDEVKIFGDNSRNLNSDPSLWLKFDKITEGENYFTYGVSPFCINGMVTSDREAQPELWQAKHSMSPVRFESKDPMSGNFTAVNKYSFTNFNEFDFNWYLYKDGKLENSGTLNLDVAPQSKKDFNLPIPNNIDNKNEYVLEISCKTKNDIPFLSKGFEIDFHQFVLNKKNIQLDNSISKNQKLNLMQNENEIKILVSGNEYRIDKKSGSISLFKNGKNIFEALNANVWRAPIDNELSEWGKAEAEDWFKMGMNESSTSVSDLDYNYSNDSTSVIVNIKSYTTFSRSSDYIINDFKYEFGNNGSVKIDHQMTPLGNFDVSWLPCIGLQLKMPDEFQNVKWYGHGPFENYNDRNTGAKIGIHSNKIDEVMNPYIRPQAYGNYSGVQWFEIQNKNSEGIKVVSKNEVDFSAVPYYNLDRANYTYQLFKDDFSRIKINYGMTGVGDTPNPVMPQYRVYPKIYSNTLLISVLKNNN